MEAGLDCLTKHVVIKIENTYKLYGTSSRHSKRTRLNRKSTDILLILIGARKHQQHTFLSLDNAMGDGLRAETPTILQSGGFCWCRSARHRQRTMWVRRGWSDSRVVQNGWRTPAFIFGIVCLPCLHKTYEYMMLALCIPWQQGRNLLCQQT
jgi:hypothetical protein